MRVLATDHLLKEWNSQVLSQIPTPSWQCRAGYAHSALSPTHTTTRSGTTVSSFPVKTESLQFLKNYIYFFIGDGRPVWSSEDNLQELIFSLHSCRSQ